MGRVTIHHNPRIKWQRERVGQFETGLVKLGFEVCVSNSRDRVSEDPAVLFGTTFFKAIEDDHPWMLVDRASYGDPDFVQLVWNGHGQRGDHMVPDGYTADRFKSHGITLQPWKRGRLRVLCGQEQPYAPITLEEWYAKEAPACSAFKPHPSVNDSYPGLKKVKNFDDWGYAVVLNSSVGVECLIRGIPVQECDQGSMLFGHFRFIDRENERRRFFEWLAWTQWRWEEIEQGEPIRHLFEWHHQTELERTA